MSQKSLAQKQIDEALGPVNRWYCSEYFRREITDPNKLIEYYIRHGGAVDFAKRHRGDCEPAWMKAVHGRDAAYGM